MTRRRSPGGTLLVASTGGHLEEIYRLLPRLHPSSETFQWATFDEPQSRSMLVDQVVHYVSYVKPRGYHAALTNVSTAIDILRRHHFDRLVSTGSGIAIPFMIAARSLGVPCHYIESAARSNGPSLTGNLLSRLPGVSLYTQYPSWATPRWNYRGSLFDQYQSTPSLDESREATKVVVTLGTMQHYGFRRAIDAVSAALRGHASTDAEILWQVGGTDISDLPFRTHVTIPAKDMREAIGEADLVIAHAGIGSALTALDADKCPVLLPRKRAFQEHVDDHQALIAEELSRRELAVTVDPSRLTSEHFATAMSMAVRRQDHTTPFKLEQWADSRNGPGSRLQEVRA